MNRKLLRIIDANLNRAREGLRVCEEITRFILEDVRLTAEFRNLRHKIWRYIKKFPRLQEHLLTSRSTETDVGRKAINKSKRKNYQDLFMANIQRVKESLRVLEEFSKVFNQSVSKYFTKLRFQVYELEKKTIARL